MISVISPAKSMNFTDSTPSNISSQLVESKEMTKTLQALKKLSAQNIVKSMKVSEKIAELNYDRFQNFETLPEKQAIYAYNGDVYNNIDTETLDENSLHFSQEHLRILSALYGILKPLDMIKAYRLEMSCKIPRLAPKGMNLFWQKNITERINLELEKHKNKFLINIASNEYSASINTKMLDATLINVHFRETRDGKLKNIALNSKRARGMLADYIIRNQIDHPDNIKTFNKSDYQFNRALSDSNNFYFTK
ncbi:MAG: YaaA family protein [Pseudomonadota bacterium]